MDISLKEVIDNAKARHLSTSLTNTYNVIPVGGGFDSTALILGLHNAGLNNVLLVHVNYGHKASQAEHETMIKLGKITGYDTKEVNLDMSYSGANLIKGKGVGTEIASNNLELRNPLIITYLASIASSIYANSTINIIMGFHKEPAVSPYRDGTSNYFEDLGNALTTASHSTIKIYAPLEYYEREQLFNFGIGLNPNFLNIAHSCYEEKFTLDCVCPHCVKAREMFSTYTPTYEYNNVNKVYAVTQTHEDDFLRLKTHLGFFVTNLNLEV